MSVQGVLISCSTRAKKTENAICSGILFADKWVLTIGTLLDPVSQNTIKRSNNPMKDFNSHQITILPVSLSNRFPKFTVLIAQDTKVNKLTAAIESYARESEENGNGREEISSDSFKQCQRRSGRVAALWRCPLVAESTNQLLSGWQLTPTEFKDHDDIKVFKTLMSTFLLLDLDGESPSKVTLGGVFSAMVELIDQLKRPQRGEEVVVESTIFGREFFFNSWSQGIVSKVFGSKEALMLTDARSASGCEGGPIFTRPNSDGSRALLGMVTSPVCWWKGEWVGFTLGVTLMPIITRLHSWSPRKFLLPSSTPSEFAKLEGGLDSKVVLVRCASAWGSGVVVDAALGLILTCTHVVLKWQNGISVCWESTTLPATLIYHNKTDLVYDLALIQVRAPVFKQQILMSYSPAIKGETVYVAGYPLFSERDHEPVVPIVSRGIVAHVTPVMLQTTCCVQSGASGGPVLRPSGEMLGIVCCNANNLDTGALFPHVNMAVPTTAFLRHIDRFRETQDVEALRPLEEPHPLVQKLWKFQFNTSKL